METPTFTDSYQNCYHLYKKIDSIFFGGAFTMDVWMIIKGVAIAFILLKWMKDFSYPIIKDGKHINPLPSIFEGLFYISLIAGSSQIMNIAELFFAELESLITSKIELPTNTFDLYDSPEFGFPTGGLSLTLFELFKTCVMALIFIIDILYFVARILGMIAWQIFFPITMTLSILSDRFKENLVTQFKVFGVIYLTGAMYLLAIYISNQTFIYFAALMPGMGAVVLVIVLLSKKQMYAKAEHWLEKIFS